MDIKRSFKRFKKNYIRESEVLDNEDFVDMNLEGSSKTGLDWYNEYDELGGSKTPEDIVVKDLDIISRNDWYYKDNSGQVFDNDGDEVEDWTPELEAFTYDEIVAELGTPEEAVNDEQQPGLSDEDYIDPETELETDAGYDTDFNESCCGGKKKSKKKLDESTGIGTYGIGDWKYENDDMSIEIGCLEADLEDDDADPDAWPYEAEALIEPKDTDYDMQDFEDKLDEFYTRACAIIGQVDSQDDSYNDGEKIIGKLDFYFDSQVDVDEIVQKLVDIAIDVFDIDSTDDIVESCSGKKKGKKKGKKFVPFWAKKKDKELKEALKILNDAGYSVINECGVDCELEDDATGFGIAFDDSDYYTEDGECEVCAICGKESCDGEYNEDGDFVCSDCAENSLEQPMEEIDPMDIYFRAGRADNIRDMNRFAR